MSNAMDWFAQKWCKDEERSYVHDYKGFRFSNSCQKQLGKRIAGQLHETLCVIEQS